MKLKDYVTLGNLVCGLGSVVSVFHHRFDLASYLILLSYFFDWFDGIVARLTKQQDKFGIELDALCDMVSQCVAPGFLIYFAFNVRLGWNALLSAAVAFFPVAMGTVRAARNNARRASYPGFFVGLPRTAFALLTVALLNSSLFELLKTMNVWWLSLVPLGVILMVSFFMVSTLPFVSHHGRRFSGTLRFGVWWFLACLPAGLIAGWLLDYPALVYDLLLFNQLIYLFVANTQVPREQMDGYRAYVNEWKRAG